jgi:hypothetical protein
LSKLSTLIHVAHNGIEFDLECQNSVQAIQVIRMFEIASTELPFDKEYNALRVIGDYCAGDVVTLAKVYCAMRGLPEIPVDKIEMV